MADTAPLPPRLHRGRVEGADVVLLGTIQGLEGEDERVGSAWRGHYGDGAPGAVGVGVPPEDLENLRRIGREGIETFLDQEFDTGSYEDTVLPQLARFGDVSIPPGDLVAAERLAREHDVPVTALDLDDQAHADLYVQEVSGFQMIRGQMRLRKLQGGALEKARSPEELMLAWDEAFNRIKGYRRIEEAREEAMVAGIRGLAADHDRVFVVLPYARAAGVADRFGLSPVSG